MNMNVHVGVIFFSCVDDLVATATAPAEAVWGLKATPFYPNPSLLFFLFLSGRLQSSPRLVMGGGSPALKGIRVVVVEAGGGCVV